MVQVREDYIADFGGTDAVEAWLNHFLESTDIEDSSRLHAACMLSHSIEARAAEGDRTWSKNHSSFKVGLEMAQILAELEMDEPSIVAAILYRAVREDKLSVEDVAKQFDEDVAHLVNGVLQMAAISSTHSPLKGSVLGQNQGQLDNVRKMLVTMIDDVRVVLIKLSERTCAIRGVKNAPEEKRQRVAREVFDIYAPIAHRLGIGYIKWELEDLSFRYLHSGAYRKIAKLLDERRVDRDQFIEKVTGLMQTGLDKAELQAEVLGRSKHIYSIWRKMRRKNLDFSEIYDIRAFRILVNSVSDCYAALGVIHSLWKHIPYEFDDYVANPKENGYRSLHTAVIGPEAKIMEVQIRTHDMHEDAELGVCAHWRYKGTDIKSRKDSYEDKIQWLRQVLEWHEEVGSISGFAEQFKQEVGSDRIYVFTPDGHVLDLPEGATPLDFAYRVHTEIGHSCRGAKVNGRIVPLTYPLRTGEQVHILTANNASPSRDWLNTSLGYITTSKARSKVTHWFKLQDRDQNIHDGQLILEDELTRLSVGEIAYSELAQAVNYEQADDMFAAIGAGDLKPTHVAHVAQRLLGQHDQQLSLGLTQAPSKSPQDGGIEIRGVGQLLTQLASCCQPVPGDDIVGYITVGRGVSVHRSDCINLLHLQDAQSNRIIEVSWGVSSDQSYSVELEILAYDREGLLRDITTVMANEKVNLTGVNTHTNTEENLAKLSLKMEVRSLEALGQVMAKVRSLPNIIEVRRKAA